MGKNKIEVVERIAMDDENWKKQIILAAEASLMYFDLSHESVTISVVDDSMIHKMNREFRAKDRPTDVLSFAAREGEPIAQAKGFEFLGDIIISLETAKRQANEYKQSVARELAFLTIHGMLHLLGYDHMTPEEEQEMRECQRNILLIVQTMEKEERNNA